MAHTEVGLVHFAGWLYEFGFGLLEINLLYSQPLKKCTGKHLAGVS